MIADRIHLEISGKADGPALIVHHALGACVDMWNPQLTVLEPHFRVIRIDMRGHGKSRAPQPPYSIEDLADDVVQVMDEMAIAKSHYLGLSIGGMVGQALAVNHPGRLERLVISNTVSRVPVEMHGMWDERVAAVQDGGMESQVAMTLARWFTEDYAKDHQDVLDWIAGMVRNTTPDGFIGCCQAIKGLDLTDRLSQITAPCLIIAGAQDQGTPPEKAREIHQRVAGSRLHIIEDAAHLSNIQASEEFNDLILPFLLEG